MIDILGIISFKEPQINLHDISISVMAKACNQNHNMIETSFPAGSIVYCQRSRDKDVSYAEEGMCIFRYGTVFSNREYKDNKGVLPKYFSSQDVSELYKEYKEAMVKYLKGNFAIIIYNHTSTEITIISSRLNMLPLFYHHSQNRFIFSSSLTALMNLPFISRNLEEKALVEQLLHYYPLGDKTYFKNIYQLSPATVLRCNAKGLNKHKYFSLPSIFQIEKVMPEEEAFETCFDIMQENMHLYTSDTNKFLLALTGGFDGRTSLSLLKRDIKDFLCYSYGMRGSKQIEIPKMIAKKLGLYYRPIYIDEEFKEKYGEYALKVLALADGTAPIIRANFPYVFEQLSDFSQVNITGLFGSEIIKPFYGGWGQVSEEIINLFMSDSYDDEFEEVLAAIKQGGYIREDIINKHEEAIREEFRESYLKRLKGFDKLTRFHIFLLEEAMRKYFMQEMRIERSCVETRTPYADDDFLTAIFRTPFAGIYKGSLKKNIFSKRNSQLLYAKIIHKAKPLLGAFVTDRGYEPNGLLSPLIIQAYKVLPFYLIERIKQKVKGDDLLKTIKWSRKIIYENRGGLDKKSNIFTEQLMADFVNSKENFRFFSMVSLRLWLQSIGSAA